MGNGSVSISDQNVSELLPYYSLVFRKTGTDSVRYVEKKFCNSSQQFLDKYSFNNKEYVTKMQTTELNSLSYYNFSLSGTITTISAKVG